MLHRYYVYILTNKNRTVFYVGVTNDLERRLLEHQQNVQDQTNSFTGRYRCIYLVYYEEYQWIQMAIAREKEIKGWRRDKKLALIRTTNPNMDFLNQQ